MMILKTLKLPIKSSQNCATMVKMKGRHLISNGFYTNPHTKSLYLSTLKTCYNLKSLAFGHELAFVSVMSKVSLPFRQTLLKFVHVETISKVKYSNALNFAQKIQPKEN